MQHELHRDESEDEGQTVVQVQQFVEESVDQEEQLTQAQQCEHVGREHDERFLGQSVDGRD